MKNKSKKVIIDTNLWISFLLSKDYTKLDEIIFSKKCVLIFSEELLDEFLTVIKRPKLRKFFTQEDTEILIDTIQEFAEFIEVKSRVEVCRDEKDNFLLSLSTYPQMNIEFWKKHQTTPYQESILSLQASHAQVMQLIGIFTNEELFTNKLFSWTGTTSLGSYCVSATSSHYDWAMKKN